MLNLLKKQFTAFRENRKLDTRYFNDFIKDIELKIKTKGIIKLSPHETNEVFQWDITRKSSKVKFNKHGFKARFLDFKNHVLNTLRESTIIAVVLRVNTSQFYQEKEITELWGYRLFLIDGIFTFERINVDEFYKDCVGDGQPEPNTVYCGPNGQIMWGEKTD